MMLVWPMIALGWVMNMTEQGLASMQRINDVMAEQSDIADNGHLLPDDASIVFENVSFGHGGGREVLRNINLKVRNGESVAIVGATGSGKTTLISLILRLYDPTRALSAWADVTSATCRWKRCARWSVSCRRTSSCSRRRFARTSGLVFLNCRTR
jgi:ABC-type transport system involved in cytochrome bd biosynthesis fused ATPase/permease subunit